MQYRRILVLGLLLTTVGLIAPARTTAADDSLYTRLGGEAAVRTVAGALVDRILLDARVNRWFAHAAASAENTAAYKSKLGDFICQATGGPCDYKGRDMVSAHKGRMVTGEAFDAVAEDLREVLVTLKVAPREQRELLDLVGTLKKSIVQS